MRWAPRTWNDVLALLILSGVPALWVWGNLPEIAMGATITGWNMVLIFYYRKAKGEAGDSA